MHYAKGEKKYLQIYIFARFRVLAYFSQFMAHPLLRRLTLFSVESDVQLVDIG